MKYKVTNKLESSIRFGKITFGPKETKELDVAPESDKFIVEKIESKGEKVSEVSEKDKLNRRKG